MGEERIIGESPGLYRWPGPKRKQTLLSATLGRLVLTDSRLLFLSTGKHDITVGKLIAGAAGNALLATKTGETDHLDLGALSAKGSLEVPLSMVKGGELKGMFKVMTITYVDAEGADQASTFAPKNGGMPDGPAWIRAIEEARAAARG